LSRFNFLLETIVRLTERDSCAWSSLAAARKLV
jgi:hypothetical protein